MLREPQHPRAKEESDPPLHRFPGRNRGIEPSHDPCQRNVFLGGAAGCPRTGFPSFSSATGGGASRKGRAGDQQRIDQLSPACRRSPRLVHHYFIMQCTRQFPTRASPDCFESHTKKPANQREQCRQVIRKGLVATFVFPSRPSAADQEASQNTSRPWSTL